MCAMDSVDLDENMPNQLRTTEQLLATMRMVPGASTTAQARWRVPQRSGIPPT